MIRVRHAPIVVFCISAMVLCLPAVMGFVHIRCGPLGQRLLWPSERFPIILHANELTLGGAPNLAAGSDAAAAIKASMDAWQSLPTASIRFAALQSTPVQDTLKDKINVLTMADTPVNRAFLGGDDGAVAATRIEYDASTGVISEADIVLNAHDKFSTNMTPGTYDLQSIVTHELGHLLGCDHAVAQNDTMFFLTSPGEFLQRYLSADSIAFATSAYPDPSRVVNAGRLSGKVTMAGKGVFGASVTALDLDRNLLYTTLTEPDGTYAISGAIGGRYAVYVEPLDGPALPGDFIIQNSNAFYKNLNTTFRTQIREQQIPSPTEKISVRQLKTELNFDLPTAPATINIDRIGEGDKVTGAGYLSVGPVAVSPGDDLALLIGGTGIARVSAIEDIRILGNGITLDTARGVRVLRNASGAEVGISALIHVAPDAVPGARTVAVRVDEQEATCTGGIIVSARRPPVATLYIPYLVTKRDEYTGIGVANPTPDPAIVRLTARDDDGVVVYDQDALVPRDISVPARSQVARTASQIFNFPAFATQTGSITLESDTRDVQAFFLSGDIGSTYLDGAEAFTRGYREVYFPDILQDPATETDIHLMNIGDAPVTAVLELVGAGGAVLSPRVSRVLAPRGKVAGDIHTLFGYGGDLKSAHVRAVCDRESLVGFALTRQPGTVFGTRALPLENAVPVLYSPQLAVGRFNIHFSTRLNIVNVGHSEASVSVNLSGDNGDALPGVSPAAPVAIAAGGQFSIDVGPYFGLAGRDIQGSIVVTSGAGSKLIGNVVFGNGDPATERLDFAAALPLGGTGESRFVFSQVAQGQGFYTGVAFLAPSGAELQIEAYRTDGTLAGVQPKVLGPGERLVAILEHLLPTTAGQVGGYVKVTSSNPVFAFELFGASDGQFLSAVPPQRLGQ